MTAKKVRRNLLQRMRRYFIAGILVAAPVAVTVFTFLYAFKTLDELTGIDDLVAMKTGLKIPGVGILITIILITFLGFFTTNIFGRKALGLWERLIERVPFISTVYKASKELFTGIFAPRRPRYRKVVLVEYPRKGSWVIGFVTNEDAIVSGDKRLVSIFIPTTPNPTSGMLLFIEEGGYLETVLSMEEAVKLVVSGAIVIPDGDILKEGHSP